MNDSFGTPDASHGTPGPSFGTPDALTSGPEQPKRPGRGRKAAAVLLPAVLVLGGLAGAGYQVKSTVDQADVTVKTEHWGAEHKPGKDPAGDVHRGRHDTELAKKLLPVPGGYRLGPDLDEYGNDSSRSGKQATADLKASGRGLTGKQRREFNQRVEKFGVQGVAGRSYVDGQTGLVVEVTLMQAKDRKSLRELQTLMTELLKFAPGVKKGPRIEGHASAKCSLVPGTKDQPIDDLYCSAQVDGIFVNVFAYAPKPLGKSDAAALVKKQLDHIKSPGEYV
ncbi:hypothetical protein ACIBI4_33800 [Streptomyces sp. NPDC050418]|uniref:hypothetical protein n=1 Tax=Streptomyces sp. NPDC050418 TaxID=3365612 RepID=UPI003796DAA4